LAGAGPLEYQKHNKNDYVKQQNHTELRRVLMSICAAGFLAGCATNAPPLPPNNPADPQVRGSSRTPRNLLAQDETTLAIERQLSATQAYAESAEKMEHEMDNMPRMQHGEMQSHKAQRRNVESAGAPIYTCLMHPQIRSEKPGNCPICGMTLVKKAKP
jgi:rubrerythrin